jgi:hypothetical protein
VARWRVCYSFSSPVDVQGPVSAYSNLGVSLYYDESGAKLVRVEHELETDDMYERSQVVDKSQENLKSFWELLEYLRGLPLPINDRSAKLENGKGALATHTATFSTQARFSLCEVIRMPDSKVFKRPDNRLLVWLWLANKARDFSETPDGDANAIRNYYMIWEDLPDRAKDDDTRIRASGLKCVRNFVSHGEVFRGVRKRLKDECKKIQADYTGRVNRFDPTDKVHRDLVHQYRTIGRELVKRELDRIILY